MSSPLTTFNPYTKRNTVCFVCMAVLGVVGAICLLVLLIHRN